MHIHPQFSVIALEFPSKGITNRKLSPWLARLLAVLLVLLMQGPAVLTQEIAWVRMLVTYTQERGLTRGVVETFDGSHPCDLCVKASEIRESEGQQEPSERPNGKLRFQFSWAEMVTARPLVLPLVCGREISMLQSPWIEYLLGRGADAPVSPPPERV
jgi:hypothetical protein